MKRPGGGWFISAQGGLRQPCATLDIAYENLLQKRVKWKWFGCFIKPLNDLFQVLVCLSHIFCCQKTREGARNPLLQPGVDALATAEHRCAMADAKRQRPFLRNPWPPIRDRWGLGFFPRIFPQQVFNLESIVGIWYESQCFFEQFGRSKDFSHQKTLFETTCSVPQWLWKSTPGHRVELSNPQSCGRVV